MAKFPFSNFFDVNGNGRMDFTEELLAMKVFEDALPEEEPDAGLDGLDDEADDGLWEDEAPPEESGWEMEPDGFEDDAQDDFDEEGWDVPQEDGEEEPGVCLTFDFSRAVVVTEDRYAQRGVRREDFPTQRAYEAACTLLDLQDGEGYVPQGSTRRREIEKRQFILGGSCVAARYLTETRGFLYAQAVKENFPLPIEVPDEDERPVTSLEELFLELAEEDPALAVEAWRWIVREFGPYPQYMDDTWAPFNGLLYRTGRFPPEFERLAAEALCRDGDFRRGLLEESPEFPQVGSYIAHALEQGREGQAAALLRAALKNPHGKGVLYEELVDGIVNHISDQGSPQPWLDLEKIIFPILEALPDKRTQRLLPQWKEEAARRLERLQPARRSQHADPLAESDKTVYTFCGVQFPRLQKVYYYRTEDEGLSIGDRVLVPGREGPAEAEVVCIQRCLRKTAPYPVDRAKFVLGKA